MVDDELVRGAHVLCAQRLDAEQLFGEAALSMASLRTLLLGNPLAARSEGDAQAISDALDDHLQVVLQLLPQVYGKTSAVDQAVMELERVSELPADADGVCCRRAALLFALAREPELLELFDDKEYASDMRLRVLPFVFPRFLRNSCQAPDAFVAAAIVLGEMWKGERLGNWPEEGRTTSVPEGS